jgi:hypothetical protein
MPAALLGLSGEYFSIAEVIAGTWIFLQDLGKNSCQLWINSWMIEVSLIGLMTLLTKTVLVIARSVKDKISLK